MAKKKQLTKKEARKVISDLVKVINQTTDDKNNLAMAVRDIITFLRGPDNDDFYIKSKTTSIVRHKIGLHDHSGLDCNDGNLTKNLDKKYIWLEHHKDHYERALLGLERLGYIDEDN